MTDQQRHEQIDLFLKQLKQLDDTYNLDYNQVYAQLKYFNVLPEERLVDISEQVHDIVTNKKYKSCNFLDFQDKLQIAQGEYDQVYDNSPIKLYVTLKNSKIKQSLEKILTFLSSSLLKEDISYRSILSKSFVSGNLILNVTNKEDALHIINFINKRLKNDVDNPNPLISNNGKVGVALDRGFSYNYIVSRHILDFIKGAKALNVEVNYENFKTYITKKSIRMNSDASVQYEMAMQLHYSDDMVEKMQTIEEITRVLLLSLENNSQARTLDYFERINNNEYNEERKKYYSSIDSADRKKDLQLLDELIKTMILKHGVDFTKEALKYYAQSGSIESITRTNNLRDRVSNSVSFLTTINMLEDLDSEINDINNAISEQNKQDTIRIPNVNSTNKTKDNFVNNDEDLLKELITVTIKKYGLSFTINALSRYRSYGSVDSITRENNLRDRVKQSITFKNYINSIDLIKKINEINDALSLQEKDEIQEKMLQNACIDTYYSFYEKEKSVMAKTLLSVGLMGIKNNDYRGITLDNNARLIVMDNIKPEEIINVLKRTLEKSGYEISEKTEDLCMLYAMHIEKICEEKNQKLK